MRVSTLVPTVSNTARANAPSMEGVAHEVAKARDAQRQWAATPIRLRVAILRRFRQLLPTHASELVAPIHPGRRSAAETLGAEVMPLADACRFVEQHAERILRPYRLGPRFRPIWLYGVQSEVRREPFGVVLIIGPSNYPLFLVGSQAIQALATGNAVVIKPGAGGGAVTQIFAKLLIGAGLDPNLICVLSEAPEAAQEAIAAGVDKVLLTGSARTGANVLAQLAPRLVPAAMELSGCDAAFVHADADLDRVTRAFGFGLRLNHGETCIAPRRAFVDRRVAPELKRRLASLAQELTHREIRSVAARAAAVRVEEALHQGAELLGGGVLPDRQGLRPTVIAGARPEMAIMREDSFAPVLSVIEVDGPEHALELAAQCPYALGTSIFGDEEKARAFAAYVRAGSIVINDVIAPTADPRLPFGGRAQSGFGSTRGAEGLLELTAVKVVSTRRGNLTWHLDGPDPEDAPMFEAYLRAAHSASWAARLPAWLTFFRLMLRKTRAAGSQRTDG